MKGKPVTTIRIMKALMITTFCLNFGAVAPTAPMLGASARAQDLKAQRLQRLRPIIDKANARRDLHQSNAAKYDTAIRNISALEQAPLKTEADVKKAIDIMQRNQINDSMVFGKGFTVAINLSSFTAGVRAEASRLTAKGVVAQIKSKSLSLSRIGGFNDLKNTLKRQFDGDAAMLKRVGARLQQASQQRGISLSSPNSAPGKDVAAAFAPRLPGGKPRLNPFISALGHRSTSADTLTASPSRTDALHSASPQVDPISASVLAGIAAAAVTFIVIKYAEEKAEDYDQDPDTGVSQVSECRNTAIARRDACLRRNAGNIFSQAGCWGQYAVDEAACLLLPIN